MFFKQNEYIFENVKFQALMLKSLPPLVNPLAIHLTQAIETFCYYHHAALKQFVNEMSLGPMRFEAFVRYSQR